MRIALDAHHPEIGQHLFTPLRGELSGPPVAPDHLGYFNVEQMRRVKGLLGIKNTLR